MPGTVKALSPAAVRAWCWIHKWSSLVCTIFLLLLCLTGLPLVFHDEIDAWLGNAPGVPPMAAGAPSVDADRVIETARTRVPGLAVQFLVHDREDPVWHVQLGRSVGAREPQAIVSIDARSGAVLRVSNSYRGAFTGLMLRIHKELLAGEVGSWILFGVGLVFLVSIVSGIVVYAPFMRRLAFGTIRTRQGARPKWLDVHNLLGIVTVAWLAVVGVTGVVNTLASQIAQHWQRNELAEMIAPWRGQPIPARIIPVQRVIDAAVAVAPGMSIGSIAYPGNPFAGPHNYAVFFHGHARLTRRILKPVLIDAETGAVTATREMPLYAKALFVSQPLHFGDYGGLPLKMIWALLDVVTIGVLASGLYLWLKRRRVALEPEALVPAGRADMPEAAE